ncbi:hypothetical protein CBR_g38708 [Chara braunii]|uniref:HAT C-terminal dimerisation domain-containing protein n=1 Tax=Chara braunii TaxID=69332 RepID=A0A388LQD1_CHABU|nr:hypothetical protein CBR_g38708 [Chara braunii]|eukprot:GBG84423.1 hypothetical protein CBR_g38708 [Chara braunii]
MGRAQRRQHEAATDHVQEKFRAPSPLYRYLVVGQKVNNKGVMMLRCTFCNNVFQGTQFQATRHFLQTNYCKDVSGEALYEIARRTQLKFEADQMERVARYAAERGLDVPGTGGARGGEAGRRPAEGGVGGDGGHGAADLTLGGGGGDTEEGVIHVDREAPGPGEEGVPEREDVPEFYPGTGERLEDWRRRAGKGVGTEGSSKRKEGGSDPAATPAGKRLRQQKVTDVYGGEWVARHKKAFLRWLYSSGVSFNAFRNQAWKAYQQVFLEQPGSSPRAVLPNHCEIASMWAVETHRAELAEELEEMDRGGQYMSLMIEWTQDLVRHVTVACAPLGKSFADRIIKRVQARIQHMLEPAHYAGFLLNPRRRHVRYFLGQIERYDAWLVGQAKRYILTQTGFELEGADYILACRRFEDFHIQQGRFGDWGDPDERACGRMCSGDSETIECASWWSQYGFRAPQLQRCALRVMHMWSCASPAERNWAVHEGIHTKKRNQVAFEKVVQLVEITANVRLTEYRRAGCGYVLPWQRDEGMLDCQAGLELEPVRTGTRRGMMDEEIARQVALITRDPIGASEPPSADAVFDRRACIFRPYPREDDSDEEPIPEAADDPALYIPREIHETHEDPDSEETRAQTARRAADRADREMLGGDEDFWGSFGEVASTGGPEAQATTPTPTRRDSSMSPPPAPSPAPRSLVSPLQLDREELGSSLPQHDLLHRGGAEERAPTVVPDTTIAAAVEEIAAATTASVLEEMAASVLEEDPPAAGGGAAMEGQVAAEGGTCGEAAAVEVEVAAAVEEEEAPSAAAVEEEIAAQAEMQRGGDNERLMQQFLTEELDPAIAGMTPGVERGFGISDSEMGTHLDLDLSVGLPPSCGGATSTDRAPLRDEAPGRTSTQTARERTTTKSPDAAHDIIERERARLLASTDPRAQAFARAVEKARRREIGGDCVQGGVVEGEDVAEGVAAEPVAEAMPVGAEAADVAVEGRPQAVDEAVQAGQRRPQAVKMAVHGVPPPVITDLGSEPVVVPPRLSSHFSPQEVHRPLDAEELVREVVRDVTRLDRRIFDRRLEHPPWQTIPSVPWGPTSPVWSGSTSTGGHTAGHVPGVSGGVTETAPRTEDMPPPPPRAPAGDRSSSPTGRGSRSPHTPGRSRIRDTTAVQQDVCDTTIFERTYIDLDPTCRVTEHTARLQPGLGGGGTRTTATREVPASGCEPQRDRGRGVSTETLEYTLRAATRAVQEQTPCKRVTIEEASARVVVLRKGGGPVTVEEDDPDTDAVVQPMRDADEDYEGEEGGEEDSRSGSDGDDDDDYDEPPPSPGPPPTRASRRSAARTSSSSRGRKRSTSGTRGGTRRHSGKGKKGR